MKIVIVSHSGIGNLIHTTPCAKALVSLGHDVIICTWPRSVDILRDWQVAHVTVDHPAVYTFDADHVIVSKCGAVWQDEWTKGTIWKAGPIKNPWTKHEVDYYMNVAEFLGHEGSTPDPEIAIGPANNFAAFGTMNRASLRPKEFVCIAAAYLKTEHWPLKHWGNQNYSELLCKIRREGWDTVFVGSKEDRKDCEEIIKNTEFFLGTDTCHINYCGHFEDIKDTAALMKQAALVVGNDGGLMHVAAAVGTKTVTVFTFTNPVKNRPYCNGEIVMVECEDRLTCQHGQWKKCGPRGCLNVPVDAVWEKTKIALASLNQNR